MLNVKYLLTNLTNYIIYINFEVINSKKIYIYTIPSKSQLNAKKLANQSKKMLIFIYFLEK